MRWSGIGLRGGRFRCGCDLLATTPYLFAFVVVLHIDPLIESFPMDTNDRDINDLFNGNKVFVVPRYQRLYVWTEEDHWDPLWDDVEHIADRLLGDAMQRQSKEIDHSTAESHFFGTLVLKPRRASLNSAAKWQVIDGQQRLTTLQLLMSALADEFVERGQPSHGIHSLMQNTVENDPLKIEHRKFVNEINPYVGFREAMGNDLADKEEIAGPMGNCYRFFRRRTNDWLGNDEWTATRIDALGTALLYKFRVVSIELDSGEEEHKIFETLNARGAPLTEWDKIKNSVLAKYDRSLDDDSLDLFYAKYLDRFDADWWRENTGSGAQSRPQTDWFADYWVESQTGEPVSVRRVFREFQQYVETSGTQIETIAAELTKDADYYQEYEQHRGGNESHERRFHNRRLALNVRPLWPGIFLLNRKLEAGEASQQIRDESFGILDSFLVRRKLLNYSTRAYTQAGFDLVKGIRNTNDVATLSAQIRDILFDKYGWPSDAEVRDAVLFRNHARSVRSLVLRAIEAEIIPPTAGYQTLASDLEVEHLMPQRWSDNDWPPMMANDSNKPLFELLGLSGDPLAIRNDLIDTLGNLTLITSGLNKSLSNGSWEHKRELVEKSDNLFINKWLLNDASDVWDERGILRRGMWIAEKVCEIWPRPEGVADN